ncbi:hypothetical protein ACWJPH_08675 [Klebsiella pneumoniae]
MELQQRIPLLAAKEKPDRAMRPGLYILVPPVKLVTGKHAA